MVMKKQYDEQRELPSPWEWIIVTALCIFLIVLGLVVYRFVLEGPRHWDFGQLPDAPAESIYSTEQPPKPGGALRRQIPRLPEAQPENPQKPPNEQLRERSPKQ